MQGDGGTEVSVAAGQHLGVISKGMNEQEVEEGEETLEPAMKKVGLCRLIGWERGVA